VLIALALLAPATVAMAEPDAGGAVWDASSSWGVTWEQVGATALDVVILRPLGFAASAVGAAAFAVSLPLVLPSKNIRASWDVFVAAPGDYTFVRPIGEF
jgi:hypothetical protein